jgi:hypothetical protein
MPFVASWLDNRQWPKIAKTGVEWQFPRQSLWNAVRMLGQRRINS